MTKKIPPLKFPPAKIPRQHKINLNKYTKSWFGSNKADKMLETLDEAKRKIKKRKAKKIGWKKISEWRYQIVVDEKHLGDIEADIFNRWKVYPSFEYDEFVGNIYLNSRYDNFNEAGRGLVDLWINT